MSDLHVLTLCTHGSHSPTILGVGTREACEAEKIRHREVTAQELTDFTVEEFLEEWREELMLKGVDPASAETMFPVEGVTATAHDEALEASVESYRYRVLPVKAL